MPSVLRITLSLFAFLLLLTFTPTASPRPAAPEQRTVVAHYGVPEVSLRKMHLVRPDLIFYPMDYEVVC